MRGISLILCISIGLSGCVFFYPKVTRYDDKACPVIHKKLVLNKKVISDGRAISDIAELIRACDAGGGNEDCLVLLLLPLATAAGTFIVSGSIVVAGNVVYWMEKKIGCALNGEKLNTRIGKELLLNPVP